MKGALGSTGINGGLTGGKGGGANPELMASLSDVSDGSGSELLRLEWSFIPFPLGSVCGLFSEDVCPSVLSKDCTL